MSDRKTRKQNHGKLDMKSKSLKTLEKVEKKTHTHHFLGFLLFFFKKKQEKNMLKLIKFHGSTNLKYFDNTTSFTRKTHSVDGLSYIRFILKRS